jgi:DNA polymerase elongation subunit (family B)
MGAPGINFNYPKGAALVTEKGREILAQAIDWAKHKDYRIVNADTDSISYVGGTNIKADLIEINDKMPDGIKWEDDGVYTEFLVVKSKNYATRLHPDYTKDGQVKTKIKGSGLKATMKEKALQTYINDVIDMLIQGNNDAILPHYHAMVERICAIEDMSQWCSKKTITKAVLEPKRTNESRVKDAVGERHVQEGDKVYVFFEEKDKLCLLENFSGTYHKPTLLRKLYDTIKVFSTVLDIKLFTNYSLKGNQKILVNRGLLDEIK